MLLSWALVTCERQGAQKNRTQGLQSRSTGAAAIIRTVFVKQIYAIDTTCELPKSNSAMNFQGLTKCLGDSVPVAICLGQVETLPLYSFSRSDEFAD